MDHPLDSYPVTVDIPVAWGDMDSFGHVNNTIFFRYFETARISYLEQINFMNVMETEQIGPIMAYTACRFKKSLYYPDTVTVGASVTEIQEDRFHMRFCVYSHAHRNICAEGDAIIVSFDYKEDRKTPVPEVVRKKILALEKNIDL